MTSRALLRRHLMTPFLTWRGLLDLKERYLSVCVFFLYTLVTKVPSSWCITRISRKGSFCLPPATQWSWWTGISLVPRLSRGRGKERAWYRLLAHVLNSKFCHLWCHGVGAYVHANLQLHILCDCDICAIAIYVIVSLIVSLPYLSINGCCCLWTCGDTYFQGRGRCCLLWLNLLLEVADKRNACVLNVCGCRNGS